MNKQEIIDELRRVAEKLQTTSLPQSEFKRHSRISVSRITSNFGTWNEAISAAGLIPIPSGPSPELRQQSISDDDLLQEIIRLTQELGKKPTGNEMSAKGHYSEWSYRHRWGTLSKACQVAYAKYGFPNAVVTTDSGTTDIQKHEQLQSNLDPKQIVVPQTYKPSDSQPRKKVQFGEPIDFRGLRFAPINEQGVVFVFGMISRELGFLIESIRTDYPDCEGKRRVDPKKQMWEHVLIEFEYRSSNFKEHGHRPEDSDLIVCWIHDWEECPVEVLELRSQLKYLPNR